MLSTRATKRLIETGVRQKFQPKRLANYYLSKKKKIGTNNYRPTHFCTGPPKIKFLPTPLAQSDARAPVVCSVGERNFGKTVQSLKVVYSLSQTPVFNVGSFRFHIINPIKCFYFIKIK